MTEKLKMHMIRRTKATLQTELTILPRQEKRIVLEFTNPEKALYDYLERLLYHQLIRHRENGGNSLLASSAILYLRLKQVCGHHMILLEKFPDLIPLVKSGRDDTVVSSIEESDNIQREKSYYEERNEFEEALEIIESY